MAHILVFGTGNIGSVYTCILDRGGASVTCVCRSNYGVARSHGLRVKSAILGDLHSRPSIVRNVTTALSLSKSSFDFVLVCTKATPQTTSLVIESIRPAIIPGLTTIVLIQNGLGIEQAFRAAFPETTIISGVAYLPTEQVSPGVFSHSEVELVHLGLYPLLRGATSSTAQLHSFANQLRAGGATVAISEDIQAQRWIKIVANGAINPICALSRCRDRQLIELSPSAATLFKDVMLEITAVAASAGYNHIVTAETVEKQLTRSLNRPYPGVQPSMMADAEALRPMEVQAIVGEIVRTAQDKRVETPRLMTLFVLLQGLDFALQAKRN
jgi:2-dehydropantoate 2-reductase